MRFPTYWIYSASMSAASLVAIFLHGKNGFAEVSKHLDKYRSENNFINQSK